MSGMFACERELYDALTLWDTRDPAIAQPEVRRAANAAVDAIDDMLRQLHQLRDHLMTQTRDYDDKAGARVDAFLAGLRARREHTTTTTSPERTAS